MMFCSTEASLVACSTSDGGYAGNAKAEIKAEVVTQVENNPRNKQDAQKWGCYKDNLPKSSGKAKAIQQMKNYASNHFATKHERHAQTPPTICLSILGRPTN